ncbi:MAG: hypothetical protein GC158_05905 [Cyanobacteria bacterium RI_101]|nr:hypothetical protein [Cyanobacteria bacterium RI_101]
MKINPKYPIWFPYPISWLKTIILVLIGFPLSTLIMAGYLIVFSQFSQEYSLIMILLAGLCIGTPIVIFSLFYYYLWYRKIVNTSKRALLSLWEGFFATVVLTISFIGLLILLWPFINFYCSAGPQEYTENCEARMLGKLAGGMLKAATFIFDTSSDRGVVWLNEEQNWSAKPWFIIFSIFTLYLYQLEYLVLKTKLKNVATLSHSVQSKLKTLRKPKAEPKQNTIDDELAALKRKIDEENSPSK